MTADGIEVYDCEVGHIIDMDMFSYEGICPKNGAQFHFTFPGSVQGFQVQVGEGEITNVELGDARGLKKGQNWLAGI